MTAAPMPADAPERRLHPLSWLFVLLQQLKQFIVPLIVLFFFGRGDRNELWPLIGVGVLALVSLWQYFTYRYRIAGDSLVVTQRPVRTQPAADSVRAHPQRRPAPVAAAPPVRRGRSAAGIGRRQEARSADARAEAGRCRWRWNSWCATRRHVATDAVAQSADIGDLLLQLPPGRGRCGSGWSPIAA